MSTTRTLGVTTSETDPELSIANSYGGLTYDVSTPLWMVVVARKYNARPLRVNLCRLSMPYADVDQTSSYELLDFVEAVLGGWR